MKKTLNTPRAAQAMEQAGLNQSTLALRLDVSKEAVSQWFKHTIFPRPDKLLKLAKILNLDFNELVIREEEEAPVVAFRKVKGTKTRDHHIDKAQEMGRLLRLVVPYLPFDKLEVPPTLKDPVNDYGYIQQVAAKVRKDINLDQNSSIDFPHLIKRFLALQAVIVPVLWGDRKVHENAIHIYLPDSGTTWVYLNLDVHIHDFKFWMAHELGHCLSPTLRGEPAEDFADAFAGALLFPVEKADAACKRVREIGSKKKQLAEIVEMARKETISPYTVYMEMNKFAEFRGFKKLDLEPDIFKWINKFNDEYEKLSEALFSGEMPEAEAFVKTAADAFNTPFFAALGQYLKASQQGPGYVQTVMDIPLLDARGIHEELT